MAETQNLKPCPFCGQDAAVLANEYRNEEGGWFVHCVKCDGSTGLRYSCGEDARPLVIEAWNRRAALSEQPSKDERAAFEAWYERWRVSTWRPLPSDPRKECPAHWNTDSRHDAWLGWQARAASPQPQKENS